MSRDAKTHQRVIESDPTYDSRQVAKLINRVMKDGKKSIAEKVVYEAFDHLKTNSGNADVLSVFHKAIENVREEIREKIDRVAVLKVDIEGSESLFYF